MESDVQKTVQSVFEAAWNLAVDKILERWGSVVLAAETLMNEGEMTGDRFREVINEAGPAELPTEEHIQTVRDAIRAQPMSGFVARSCFVELSKSED